MHIPLSSINYGQEEIDEVLDSLRSGNVTMGEKVARFEEQFAAYIGVKYGVMLNSGSSANLLALTILNLPKGSEVITPAVTWSTTVSPILQTGSVPVFVDVYIPDLTLRFGQTLHAIEKETACVMPVHLLGNPVDMELMPHPEGRFVIEDCCEAHGAQIGNRKVGSFGDISNFSFYFSHHISTIEGGMLLTNNEDYANEARSLRSHGWTRDRTDKAKWQGLSPHFTFVSAGYSFCPTELQGAMGLHQLPRLEGFIRDRERNADYWNKHLNEEHLILPHPRQGVRHAWFAYPIGVRKTAPYSRDQLVTHLNRNGVDTRPVMSGNITRQPFMEKAEYRAPFPLTNADEVELDWFLIGNHSGIGEPEREYVAQIINSFTG